MLGGFYRVYRVHFVSETAQVELRSEQVSAPAVASWSDTSLCRLVHSASMSLARGLHSSTFQLNLSRFGHPRVPLSNGLGENHAPNVYHRMCLR